MKDKPGLTIFLVGGFFGLCTFIGLRSAGIL